MTTQTKWTEQDQRFLDNLTRGIERSGRDGFFSHYITTVQDEVRLLRIPDVDRLRIEDPRMWVHLQGWLENHPDLPERTRQHICAHRSTMTEYDGTITCNRCGKNAEVIW